MRSVATVFLVLACSSAAYPQKKEGVVVMPLKSGAITKTALAAINDLVVFSMTKKSPFKVVSRTDLEAQLDREQIKDMLDCNAVACAAEIGGALGTRYLLAGSVRKLGSKIIVNLNLIDTTDRETKRGQAKVTNDEDLYEQAVENAVRQVLALETPPKAPPVVAGPRPGNKPLPACSASTPRECLKLAQTLEENDDYLSQLKAKNAYVAACDGGAGGACARLSRAYTFGELGVDRNSTLARAYVKRACELGYRQSCGAQ